jgi:hypothetical protein
LPWMDSSVISPAGCFDGLERLHIICEQRRRLRSPATFHHQAFAHWKSEANIATQVSGVLRFERRKYFMHAS